MKFLIQQISWQVMLKFIVNKKLILYGGNKLDSEKLIYNNMVKFVLGSMIDLWLDKKNNGDYSFVADLNHYYKSTIIQEGVLNPSEFENLVIEVLEEKGIKKGTLT